MSRGLAAGRWRRIAAWGLVLGAAGCTSHPPGPLWGDDMAVQRAVAERLASGAGTRDLALEVRAVAGIVRLYGVVPDEASRAAAVEEARRAPGVRGVIDRLEVAADPANVRPSVDPGW